MIEIWSQGLPTEARADFDWVIRELAGTEDWRDRRDFKPLRGKHAHFAEIRFKTNNVQYRPVGRFRPNREFVLLIGCSKKQKVFTPPDAFDQAVKRWGWLQQGRGSLCEHFL